MNSSNRLVVSLLCSHRPPFAGRTLPVRSCDSPRAIEANGPLAVAARTMASRLAVTFSGLKFTRASGVIGFAWSRSSASFSGRTFSTSPLSAAG